MYFKLSEELVTIQIPSNPIEARQTDLHFPQKAPDTGSKADKLSRTQCAKSVERYKATLGEQWEELPPMFVSSGERGTGREEILGFIGECLDV